MSYFNTYDIDIGLSTLIALVTVGRWENESTRASSLPPIDQRYLHIKLADIGDKSSIDIDNIVKSFDWNGSQSGSSYFIDIDSNIKLRPEKTKAAQTWNYGNCKWEDARTLQEIKNVKWAEIKKDRQNAEFGGFVWDGSIFDSDQISQSRLQGALQLSMLSPDFSVDWTIADNTIRTLSKNDIAQIGVALGNHASNLHSKARLLREEIERASDVSIINSIVW